MKLTISQEGCNPITIRTVESESPKGNDIADTIRKIEQLYKINIPSQLKCAMISYSNELEMLYRRTMNTVNKFCYKKHWRFEEPLDAKYGIKPKAHNDFVISEIFANGDKILAYKNNQLYYNAISSDTPLLKIIAFKDYNDYFNKTIKPYFNKKDKYFDIETYLTNKANRSKYLEIDSVSKQYTL